MLFSPIRKCKLVNLGKEISGMANFGIFKQRDSAIVDKIIEVKQKYGYPKLFETSWAKNSNKDVLELAMRLDKEGLLRKFGVSVQSMDDQVLTNIKPWVLNI